MPGLTILAAAEAAPAFDTGMVTTILDVCKKIMGLFAVYPWYFHCLYVFRCICCSEACRSLIKFAHKGGTEQKHRTSFFFTKGEHKMVISLYIVILLTGFLIFIICAFADSSLLIFNIGCIVGFFMFVGSYIKLLSLVFPEIFDIVLSLFQ